MAAIAVRIGERLGRLESRSSPDSIDNGKDALVTSRSVMPERADEQSRILGGLVCLGAVAGGALFLYGIAVQSYWALAVPLAAIVLFVLGLVVWIGWTIATVQVETEGEPLGPGGAGSATRPDPSESSEPVRSESED